MKPSFASLEEDRRNAQEKIVQENTQLAKLMCAAADDLKVIYPYQGHMGEAYIHEDAMVHSLNSYNTVILSGVPERDKAALQALGFKERREAIDVQYGKQRGRQTFHTFTINLGDPGQYEAFRTYLVKRGAEHMVDSVKEAVGKFQEVAGHAEGLVDSKDIERIYQRAVKDATSALDNPKLGKIVRSR